MKRKNWTIRLCAALAGISAAASPALAQQFINYDQVALLKWYTNQVTTYKVGNSPSALAFDGENMWVANSGDNTVTKLRAYDGANLGTFPVGSNPQALAFDGANIWVGNNGDSTVTKLRASDGANLGTFPLKSAWNGGTSYQPYWLGFDGVNLWESGFASGTGCATLKLQVTDASPLACVELQSQGQLFNLAIAGTYVVQGGSAESTWGSLTQVLPTVRGNNGLIQLETAVLDFPLGPGDSIESHFPFVATDGVNVWLEDQSYIYKVRAGDGALLASYPGSPSAPGTPAIGNGFLAFDGANLWAPDGGTGVMKFRASDGAFLGDFPAGKDPVAVAFDGANVWVANQGDNTVSKF